MTILRIGVAPEPYIDYEAALLAAANNDTFRAATAQLFAAQVLDLSGLTGITFDSTDDVGGDYTIGLDTTATYAMKLGDGFAMVGGTIKAKANRAILADDAISVSFTGVNWYMDAGSAGMMLFVAAGASVTIDGMVIDGDAATSVMCAIFLYDGGMHLSNVRCTDTFAATVSLVWVYQSALPITISGVNSYGVPLIRAQVGFTVDSLTVQGCYAANLVDKNGTITTFVGSYNVYGTTDAGTTGPGDVAGVTDFKIDWRGWPKPTSPLFRALPAGTQYGGDLDALGNPNNKRDIGPIQNQSQEGLSLAVMA